MPLVLGIDPAWTETGSSGVALLQIANGRRTLLEVASSYAEFLTPSAKGRRTPGAHPNVKALQTAPPRSARKRRQSLPSFEAAGTATLMKSCDRLGNREHSSCVWLLRQNTRMPRPAASVAPSVRHRSRSLAEMVFGARIASGVWACVQMIKGSATALKRQPVAIRATCRAALCRRCPRKSSGHRDAR